MLLAQPRQAAEAITRWAYHDNNATTRTDPEAARAMLPFLTESFGNLWSSHDLGRAAARAVAAARWQIPALRGGEHEEEIVFTAGATEANNAALRQALGRDEVVVSAVERAAVLAVRAGLEQSHGRRVHRIDDALPSILAASGAGSPFLTRQPSVASA
jgi:cysteine desulfurase